jgi:hypothetical protein
MAGLRHEIPTHLNVEDKAFLGLSARQLMHLVVGLAGAYAAWSQWPDWPGGARIALAGAIVLGAAIVALVRPGDRALEEWAIVALRYWATPKRAVWRRAEPVAADWRPAEAAWAELAPRVAWTEDGP